MTGTQASGRLGNSTSGVGNKSPELQRTRLQHLSVETLQLRWQQDHESTKIDHEPPHGCSTRRGTVPATPAKQLVAGPKAGASTLASGHRCSPRRRQSGGVHTPTCGKSAGRRVGAVQPSRVQETAACPRQVNPSERRQQPARYQSKQSNHPCTSSNDKGGSTRVHQVTKTSLNSMHK